MPDTGPPWNIPYVEPTDNPRVYPQASEDLAEAIADGLDAAGNAGIGSNVVTASPSDFTTSSSSFVTVTGLAVTITPSTATSKILILHSSTYRNFNNAAESRTQITATSGASPVAGPVAAVASGGEVFFPGTQVFLHSPGTASAVTYQVEFQRSLGTGNISLLRSHLTAIEVAP